MADLFPGKSLSASLKDTFCDLAVFQQNSAFFLISSVFLALTKSHNNAIAAVLLYFGLSNQLFGNIFLSRESTVQLCAECMYSDVFRHTIYRAVLLLVIALISIPISKILGLPIFCDEILYSALMMITISAQTMDQMSAGLRRDYSYALIAVSGCACFILHTWNSGGCLATVIALILVSLFKMWRRWGRAINAEPSHIARRVFTPGRVGLWLAALASSEYDRYLVARGGKSLEGVSLGIFGSLVNLPLAVASSLGPRLMNRPFGNRENWQFVLAGLLYLLLVLAVSWNFLQPAIFLLLAGSSAKIFGHLLSNQKYFLIMSRSVILSTLLSTTASLIAGGATVFVVLGNYYAAAALKLAAGVAFSVGVALTYTQINGGHVHAGKG